METEDGPASKELPPDLLLKVIQKVVGTAKDSLTAASVSLTDLWGGIGPEDAEQQINFLLKVISGLIQITSVSISTARESSQVIVSLRDDFNTLRNNISGMKEIFGDASRMQHDRLKQREKKARERMVDAGRQLISTMRIRTRWEQDVDAASKDKNVTAWLGVSPRRAALSPVSRLSLQVEDAFSPLATLTKKRNKPALRQTKEQQALLPDSLVLSSIDKWNFNQQLAPQDNVLVEVAEAVFSQYTFADLKIPFDMIRCLLVKIQNGYMNVPYHNKRHAADVLQSMHAMLKISKIIKYATDVQLFAILMAALCHDYGHPGYDVNLFRSLCPKAAGLFSSSPLENFHAVTSWAVLEPELVTCVAPDILQDLKQLFFSYILSTDTSRRRENVRKLSASPTVHLLLKVMLHAADISNPTKTTENYINWTAAVMTEFWCQGDIQKELGLEISPMCDAETIDVAKCQLGFVGMMVKPIYDTLNEWFIFEEHTANMMKNIAMWSNDDTESKMAINKFKESYDKWSSLTKSPVNRATEKAQKMTLKLSTLISYVDNVCLEQSAAYSQCSLSDTIESLLALQICEAEFRSHILQGFCFTVPIFVLPSSGSKSQKGIRSAKSKNRTDFSYQFQGVEKMHPVEPMFSVLKIDRQHMALDSYPVRNIALASSGNPLVGEYRLYPDSRTEQPIRKLLPVVVAKPKVPAPPVSIQEGLKSIPFRRFC